MNGRRILKIAGIALLALLLYGCGSDPVPVGFLDSGIGGERIDSTLDRLAPELTIRTASDGGYLLAMTAGAGGYSDSPQLQALRSIQAVRFDLYNPDHRLVTTLSSNSVWMSGVKNAESGELSVVASTAVRYMPTEQLPTGAYAVMKVIGANGIARRSATFPDRTPVR
jgi:hypothetical protein